MLGREFKRATRLRHSDAIQHSCSSVGISSNNNRNGWCILFLCNNHRGRQLLGSKQLRSAGSGLLQRNRWNSFSAASSTPDEHQQRNCFRRNCARVWSGRKQHVLLGLQRRRRAWYLQHITSVICATPPSGERLPCFPSVSCPDSCRCSCRQMLWHSSRRPPRLSGPSLRCLLRCFFTLIQTVFIMCRPGRLYKSAFYVHILVTPPASKVYFGGLVKRANIGRYERHYCDFVAILKDASSCTEGRQVRGG